MERHLVSADETIADAALIFMSCAVSRLVLCIEQVPYSTFRERLASVMDGSGMLLLSWTGTSSSPVIPPRPMSPGECLHLAHQRRASSSHHPNEHLLKRTHRICRFLHHGDLGGADMGLDVRMEQLIVIFLSLIAQLIVGALKLSHKPT